MFDIPLHRQQGGSRFRLGILFIDQLSQRHFINLFFFFFFFFSKYIINNNQIPREKSTERLEKIGTVWGYTYTYIGSS